MPSTCTGTSMMFCSTVMWAQRLKCWNTMASLVRRRCSCLGSWADSSPLGAATSLSSSPATWIRPWWGFSSMLLQRRKVLLPEPELPMMLITSPAWAESETPLSTSLLPKRLWMLSTWSLRGLVVMVRTVGHVRGGGCAGSGAQQFAGSERGGTGNFADFGAGQGVAVTDPGVENPVYARHHAVDTVSDRVNHFGHHIAHTQGLANVGGVDHHAGLRGEIGRASCRERV